ELDPMGQTALHLAVFHGHTNIVKLLVSHGAHADIPNEVKATQLELALMTNKPDIIELLLKQVNDTNLLNKTLADAQKIQHKLDALKKNPINAAKRFSDLKKDNAAIIKMLEVKLDAALLENAKKANTEHKQQRIEKQKPCT